MRDANSHVEPFALLVVPKSRSPHATTWLNSAHVQLRRLGQNVTNQIPLHEIRRVVDRDSRVVFESRRDQEIIRSDADDRRVRVEP